MLRGFGPLLMPARIRLQLLWQWVYYPGSQQIVRAQSKETETRVCGREADGTGATQHSNIDMIGYCAIATSLLRTTPPFPPHSLPPIHTYFSPPHFGRKTIKGLAATTHNLQTGFSPDMRPGGADEYRLPYPLPLAAGRLGHPLLPVNVRRCLTADTCWPHGLADGSRASSSATRADSAATCASAASSAASAAAARSPCAAASACATAISCWARSRSPPRWPPRLRDHCKGESDIGGVGVGDAKDVSGRDSRLHRSVRRGKPKDVNSSRPEERARSQRGISRSPRS